jgi:very-short-patch-repair endonuclease
MSGGMDLEVLRELVEGVLNDFAGLWGHRDISIECERLGLPEPPPEGECSKRVRVARSLAALPDAGLPAVAERIVSGTMPLSSGPAARFAIEDVLWAGRGVSEVPKRVRREIARDLDGVLDVLTRKAERFMALLESLWNINNSQLGFFASDLTSLRGQIEQHVIRNPGDWTAEDLFERLGAFDSGDARFGRFIEGLLSADLIPDEPAQRAIADLVNLRLRKAGAELRETGADGGYPVFSVVPVGAARHRQPKNLVFASQVKPDIRISDAISNDIEILENADQVLVYDRPIGSDGLRWRDLQEWWKDTRQPGGDEEAKRSLYQRLASALPGNSPPQRNLFDLYYKIHGTAVPALPALLPEVWLHWDPKTVRERGAAALLGHRMDFLLLLRHGQRVVLEVDGSHHYSSPDGTRPAPARYAAMARADRELKLSGYEVFRFGATELKDSGPALTLLQAFFADLFRRFNVTP